MSTEKPTIYAALAKVMREVGAIGKDSRNLQGGYNFRGVDAVVNAVAPALRAHEVIVVPQITDYMYGEIEVGKNRTPMGHARVMVNYTFYGPAGDKIVCSTPGEAFDSGDKATPKAMSVAFRTALIQALALPTDEPDPDSQSYERAHQERPQANVEVPPLAAAKARAWNVGRRLFPHAKPDELKRETEDALMDLGSSIADADTAKWNELAAVWEAQYDRP